MKIPDSAALSRVLDGLKQAVLLSDSAKAVRFMNGAAEDLLHISAQRAVGQPVMDVVPLGMILQAALIAGAQGTTTTLRQTPLRRVNPPSEINVDCTVSALPLGEGSDYMIIELNQVDHLRKIAQETWLQDRQGAFGDVVRSLAHEIKNPLGGLRGAAQLLDRELPKQNTLREYTRIITHEADRLSGLVDRLTGGYRDIKREPFNLHAVLEHVRKLTLVEIPLGLDVDRDYDPSIPDVVGDREQMIQAVLNIVRNAVQAMGSRGTILLKTRVRRQHTLHGQRHRLVVEASISDDGPGIDPQLIDRIFFPMVTGRADGTGLGLAITQEIIRRHNGVIECTSEPGKTRFSIFLPMGHRP